MAEGATLITPNNRLSNSLLQQYFSYCHAKTVDKPRCMPYASILHQAYQHFTAQQADYEHPILLNTSQCQHLWRNLIKQQPHITYSEGLLNAFMEAWEHCQLWSIDCQDKAFQYTPQTKQFQALWQEANHTIEQSGFITEQQIVPYLMNKKQRFFSKTVVWVCFDDFNPQQIALQHYLDAQGTKQYQYDLAERATQVAVFSAADNKEEYEQLIAFLQVQLNQSDKRIGVVIPDLQEKARFIERIFTDHFDTCEFDISLGRKLDGFPLIAHALTWLNLDAKYLSPHQAALLLQSPYLGFAKEEFVARSQYLQDSALLQESRIALVNLSKDCALQLPKLSALLDTIKPYPAKASPQNWVLLLQERLNAIGFPGDYGLNSENYQCFNRFNALFDDFRQLSLISPQLSTEDALDAFNSLVTTTIFQAQKNTAPIQISGLLEASGCEFDSLWVMGLNDHCLPQKTRLSAFIPPQLQRDLCMPHCIPAKELQFAEQTLERLRKGSQSLVFSYAKLVGDNPNLPCSLITQFPPYQALSINSSSPNPQLLMHSEESYNLPLMPTEQFSGGTRLLANQAKCPFKAFAEHRLAAKPLLQSDDGLNNLEKGQVIHKVMEILWTHIKSQHQLMALDEDTLDTLINTAILSALNPLKTLHPDSFPSLMQEVEATRLKRIVLECLDWEKKRPPFEVIALEQAYTIPLSGLDFKVRIDRLDKIADKKWVIDYKSSLPTNKPWNEERPKEPQLLLYALLDEEINALILLQLKSGAIDCNGISEEESNIKGLSTVKKGRDWQDYRNDWKEQLTLLANEFQQGHCPPMPSSPSLCQNCDFHNLCRFQSTQ